MQELSELTPLDQYMNAANLNARISLHQKYSINQQGWTTFLWDQLAEVPDNAQVLDLGCGQGNFWKANQAQIPQAWVITLSDLSEGMLLDAWKNLVIIPRSFKYKQADACDLPFPDSHFDLVIANHMLYAVNDTNLAIKEIRRVLKPGGTFMAATNGNGHMAEIFPFVSKIDPSAMQDPASIFYLNPTFTLDNGAEQLRPVFSSVVRVEYEDALLIDQVKPIMDYIHSGFDSAKIDPIKDQATASALQSELINNGPIKINKRAGCFVCK